MLVAAALRRAGSSLGDLPAAACLPHPTLAAGHRQRRFMWRIPFNTVCIPTRVCLQGLVEAYVPGEPPPAL
jgi:hypothetical protein